MLVMFLNFYFLCGRVVQNLRVNQSSASAPTQVVRRCSGWNLNNLDPIIWSLKELFSATNQAIRLCSFNALTQPQEFDNKNMGAAPSIQTRVLQASDREVPILRVMRKKSPTICNLRRVDRLSPHHDSQFSAFSTKVLLWINQGTIVVVLPLLPQSIQRNVRQQAQEPGNPTIAQRHDSEPMHIVLNSGCRTIL